LDARRLHSQIESDVNTLLGAKESSVLSLSITGLGGGAFLPAAMEKPPTATQDNLNSQGADSTPFVVDTTARCMFFVGLLLPLLLLVLVFLPRPPSIPRVGVRFWKIGERAVFSSECSAPSIL
jgi:hypothetical protein